MEIRHTRRSLRHRAMGLADWMLDRWDVDDAYIAPARPSDLQVLLIYNKLYNNIYI